ncbi:MAG TPA: hypothetical protein VI298_08670 [Geobacteraceae bacterium]
MAKQLKKGVQDVPLSEEEMGEMENMTQSSAYLNRSHPQHAATVLKVAAGYKRGFKRGKK